VFTARPISSPTVASTHRDGVAAVSAASTARFARVVVTYATDSDAASSTPSPASTSRSRSTRTTSLPGYSGRSQILRMEDRSTSTQNQPVIGKPMNAMTPAVLRALRHVCTSTVGRFSAA
jgi:hypothetical protein